MREKLLTNTSSKFSSPCALIGSLYWYLQTLLFVQISQSFPSFHCDGGIIPKEFKDGWKQRMGLMFILRLCSIIIIILY